MGGVALRHGAVGLDASLAQLVDRGLGEIRVLLVAAVYGGLVGITHVSGKGEHELLPAPRDVGDANHPHRTPPQLSLIHISEPTRLGMISYAVFCLKKENNRKNK